MADKKKKQKHNKKGHCAHSISDLIIKGFGERRCN